MNRIFKVKWNADLNRFDVTSELTRGKTKSRTSIKKSQIKAIFLLLLSSSSHALPSEIELVSFKPEDSKVMRIDDSKTLIGAAGGNGFSDIYAGERGYIYTTLGDLYAQGKISPESAEITYSLVLGSTVSDVFYDENLGGNVTFSVFDNGQIREDDLRSFGVAEYLPVGDQQYIGRNLIQIKGGGELNVNVGSSDSDWKNDPSNTLRIYLKGLKDDSAFISSVFKMDASGTDTDAILNYNSNTVVSLGNANNAFPGSGESITSAVQGYSGSFDSKIGKQRVTNVEELKAYNNSLIQAVKNGLISPSDYENQFRLAWDNSPKKIYIDYAIAPDDAVNQPINKGIVSYILADGNKNTVNVSRDANVQLYSSDASLFMIHNGATLNNDGMIGSIVNSGKGSYVVKVSNGIVNNNGVIDAGTNRDLIGYSLPGSSASVTDQTLTSGQSWGVIANNRSVINNNEVINVAPRSNWLSNLAVQLYNSAMINNGAINVSAASEPDSVKSDSAKTIGVQLLANSSLLNNGTIYSGREAQKDKNQIVNDLPVTRNGNVLVDVRATSSFINAASGELIIGKLSQGVTAVESVGIASSAINEGRIIINGDSIGITGNAPLQNVGMRATSDITNSAARSVENAGTIILNGINAIGMQALYNANTKQSGAVQNTGVIDIVGGLDPVFNTANYGLWAEGVMATATNAGTIRLEGDGAIAAHARDGGTLEITRNGTVDFMSGNHQTGYYVFGAGSSIVDNSTTIQNVVTDDSTLYRVDGGASFNGSNTQVDVTGERSSALLVTSNGLGTDSTLTSSGMDLKISGTNATGIRVEGSAQGILSADTLLTLSGSGSTAGIVDGSYTDIVGNTRDVGSATLTSVATLNSGNAAPGAVGYIARNGGTLDHRGSVDFSAPGTTGVQVQGGVLDNSGTVRVNGTAVDVSGADSVVSNTGTVEATNGTAAFRVRDGAALDLSGSGTVRAGGSAHGVLLDSGAAGLTVDGATIEMTSGGTGSGIENAAEIEGIRLKDTTITAGDGYGVRTAATLAAENSGTITVNGAGAGLYFGHADGSESDGDVDTSKSQDLVINVNGAQGSGVVTHTRGDVKSGVSVNVNDAAGGSALVVEGDTRSVEQSGTLTSKSLTAAVTDLSRGSVSSFINRGTLQAAGAAYDALRTAAGSYLNFTNARGGHITGRVALADGNNSVTLEGGSTADDVTTGSGSDNFYLSGIRPSDTGLFRSLQAGAGADTLNLSNAVLMVTDPATLTGFETVALSRGSEFTLSGTLLPLGDARDDAAGTGYTLSGDSTLHVLAAGSTAFNSFLRGAGTVAADAAGGGFDFTANNSAAAGQDFTGTLALTDATFALGGLNAQALAAARLLAGAGSTVSVADGVQRIGGLAFDGGTVAFNTGTPGESAAKGSVQTADLLDLSGCGTVQVNAGIVDNGPVLPSDRLPLMAQDDANTLLKLAGSDGAVTGSGGNLVIKDQNGSVISDALHTQVTQNGQAVADATYDYRLTGGAASDGLYVNYGLTALNLLTTGSDALVLDARGLTGSAADLSAALSGSGDLAIDTGVGQTVSLSHADNRYTGRTAVRSGTLQMGNDNVLGQTSALSLAAGTAFDMNGHSQTVGRLEASAGSLTDLNGGSLTLSQGGTADGRLQGAGALNITGGTLTVSGGNAGLTAATTIGSGADVQLNSTLGLGTGSIVNDGLLALKNAAGNLYNRLSGAGETRVEQAGDVTLLGDNSGFGGQFAIEGGSSLTAVSQQSLGTAAVNNEGQLNLNSAASWLLENSITGGGALAQNGSGVVTLSDAAAQYTGNTAVKAGGLQLGAAGQPVTLASGDTDVAAGALFGGFGGTTGDVNNAGTLQLGALGRAARAVAQAADFTVGGNLTSRGTLAVAQPGVAGSLLHVKGDYTGHGGRLVLNTVLGGDGSLTDRLLVDGDTRGSTAVTVNNAGGSGASTIDGIEVITVRGKSEGEFTQAGRIVAGAYEYHLARGDAENRANWYLRNTVKDEGGSDGGDGGGTPGEIDDEVVRVYRPEAGAYAANLAAANTLFTTRLHDRLGETHYTDALTGEQKVTSMWLRNTGGHTRFSDSSGQQKTQANRYVMQLGGDVAQWSSDGADRYHLGVMAGYANQHSSTQNRISGQSAKGSLRGYSAGLYGTWLQDNAEKTGAYVDTWALYSWFDGSVQGDSLAPESYKARGFTTSVESGYTWKIGEKNARESYYLQPKAQVMWSGVKADDIRESNGTRVSGTGEGNVQTRLGMRAFIKGHSALDEAKDRTFQTFAEVNWIANTKPYSVNLNGVDVHQKGTRNIGELKVGVEGQLKPGVNLWGNVAQQMGGSGYSDTGAMVGLKVSF